MAGLGTAIAGAGLGLIGGVGQMFAAAKSRKEMNALMQQNPEYQQNPLAQQRLGLAQSLFNSRMPGAAAFAQGIQTGAAGAMENAKRVATNPAQLLATGAATMGQAGEQMADLQKNEAAYQQQQYQNLSAAQEGAIQESDKAYQDKIRRFQEKVQAAGVAAQNRQAAWGSLGNLGGQIAGVGASIYTGKPVK
jgi:hypothetical protein